MNQLAYNLFSQKKLDAAVKLFRYNTEHTPDYANGWDSLADGLEAQGKLADALRAQEKAVQLGEAQKDPNLDQYRAHMARLKTAVAR